MSLVGASSGGGTGVLLVGCQIISLNEHMLLQPVVGGRVGWVGLVRSRARMGRGTSRTGERKALSHPCRPEAKSEKREAFKGFQKGLSQRYRLDATRS